MVGGKWRAWALSEKVTGRHVKKLMTMARELGLLPVVKQEPRQLQRIFALGRSR